MRILLWFSLSLFSLSLAGFKGLAAEPPQKEWTALLFLNGHNSLDNYGALNINQLEEVGSTDKINFVVQWASLTKNTKRLLVQKDNSKTEVTSPVVQDLAPVDMGDYHELVNFVKWGMDNYPAKKYFVIVWNHGSGWHMAGKDLTISDISYDERTGHIITTEQLGVAMRELAAYNKKPIELLGTDACLMSMAEVLGEVRGAVKYFAGSQELEPGEGWPYNEFMRSWTSRSEVDGGGLSKILTEEYVKSYSGGIYGNQDVTFSAFDMGQQEAFESSVLSLVNDLKGVSDEDLKKLGPSFSRVQRFGFTDYLDLGDLLNLIRKDHEVLSGSISRVQSALDKFVLLNRVTDRYKATTHGLSVWLPDSQGFGVYADRYSKLSFNLNARWLDFLKRVADLRVIGLGHRIRNQLLAPLKIEAHNNQKKSIQAVGPTYGEVVGRKNSKSKKVSDTIEIKGSKRD